MSGIDEQVSVGAMPPTTSTTDRYSEDEDDYGDESFSAEPEQPSQPQQTTFAPDAGSAAPWANHCRGSSSSPPPASTTSAHAAATVLVGRGLAGRRPRHENGGNTAQGSSRLEAHLCQCKDLSCYHDT